MIAFFQIDGPDTWSYQVPLEEGATLRVGRLPQNDLVLSDPSVSARHALLFQDGGKWKIQDNRSRNGIFVNGVKVNEATLQDGDLVKVGGTEMRYCVREEKPAQRSRERVLRFFSGQERALRGALDRVGPEQAVSIPTPVPIAASPQTPPPEKRPHPEPFLNADENHHRGGPLDLEQTILAPSRNDRNWMAGQVADILGDLASLRGWNKRTVFERILDRLRGIIGADNGFLMIADRGSERWVIRAWVGDASEWTSYEKRHPVPITIADQAFREDRIISNTLGEETPQAPQSDSLLMLNVHCYIAVPLHRAGVKEGLLYFDTRRSFRSFAARDAGLLDRMGAYILQVEQQP